MNSAAPASKKRTPAIIFAEKPIPVDQAEAYVRDFEVLLAIGERRLARLAREKAAS